MNILRVYKYLMVCFLEIFNAGVFTIDQSGKISLESLLDRETNNRCVFHCNNLVVLLMQNIHRVA